MQTAYVLVLAVTIAANAAIAAADLARAGFVLANSAEVGVPPAWLPWLAAAKAAGAAGLLLCLVADLLPLGVAAASGLTAFFLGAVAAHVRARVLRNLAFPAAYLALAASSLVLTATHA